MFWVWVDASRTAKSGMGGDRRSHAGQTQNSRVWPVGIWWAEKRLCARGSVSSDLMTLDGEGPHADCSERKDVGSQMAVGGIGVAYTYKILAGEKERKMEREEGGGNREKREWFRFWCGAAGPRELFRFQSTGEVPSCSGGAGSSGAVCWRAATLCLQLCFVNGTVQVQALECLTICLRILTNTSRSTQLPQGHCIALSISDE